jgi:hypothetical protein
MFDVTRETTNFLDMMIFWKRQCHGCTLWRKTCVKLVETQGIHKGATIKSVYLHSIIRFRFLPIRFSTFYFLPIRVSTFDSCPFDFQIFENPFIVKNFFVWKWQCHARSLGQKINFWCDKGDDKIFGHHDFLKIPMTWMHTRAKNICKICRYTRETR